jgi:CRP-like cAMP-binding protein
MSLEVEPIELGLVQRIHALRSLWGNAALSTSTLAAVAAHTTAVRIPAGAVLGRDGEAVRVTYAMIEGEVRGSRDGRSIGTFGPRSVVGMIPVLARDPRGFDYVATRDSTALALAADDLLEMIEDHFELMYAALRALAADAIALRLGLPDAGFSGKLRPSIECPARPLDLIERLLYLRQTFGFHESHIDALAEFARAAVEVRHAAGEKLWSAGDRSTHMLILICGQVRATDADGRALSFGPGDLVGSLDMMAGMPRWFDITVRQDLVALSLDGDLLVDIWEDQPELGFDFLRILGAMLVSLRERTAELQAAQAATELSRSG